MWNIEIKKKETKKKQSYFRNENIFRSSPKMIYKLDPMDTAKHW